MEYFTDSNKFYIKSCIATLIINLHKLEFLQNLPNVLFSYFLMAMLTFIYVSFVSSKADEYATLIMHY